MLGNWAQKIQSGAGTFGSDYLRDYTHASKIFRSNSYANSPKFKFLYHTQFEINQEAYPNSSQLNFGVLVRDVKLPSFNFNVEIKNQYNRKRLIQTKIKYDPITISFYDDNGNSINKLWYAYYTYYYKDGTKPSIQFGLNRGTPIDDLNPSRSNVDSSNYNERTQYKDLINGDNDWGYAGETSQQSNAQGVKLPFFKNITVFGFNQHDFTAWTFVNPLITTFSHDTYDYEQGGGVMKNTMTIDYETVVYNIGSIDGRSPSNIIATFANGDTYDRKNSPISTPESNGFVLGQGGLKDAAGGSVTSMSSLMTKLKPKSTVDSEVAYAGFKDLNLNINVKNEIDIQLKEALQNSPSLRGSNFDIPVRSSTPGPSGLAGSPTVGTIVAPTSFANEKPAGLQVNGSKNNITTNTNT